jgi:uncharacterized protein YecE (DUF72 family)
MFKDEIIATLREMADLLEITGAGAFEIMAHRKGAQALEDWYGDLDEAVAEGTLTKIPSIGKGLSRVIADLAQAGASAELTRIRGLVPQQLPVLLRVRGLGPARVRALWRELGVESPDDLRRACAEGRVQALRGFGEKTVERILSGLDYLQSGAPRPERPAEAGASAVPQAPQAAGRLLAGMSGYSYSEWKGTFYPDDARPADFLKLYSQRLATVEINNTFYRFPSPQTIAEWGAQTPPEFRFALKANRRITHFSRLGPSSREHIVDFVERCGQLGDRLGCILFQLPPDLARDDARLDTLLQTLPPGPRYAVEFRHESWFASDVQQKLREHKVACVAGDTPERGPRQIVTADFVYVRLRQGTYTDSELAAWDAWFKVQLEEQRDVLAYLKHDEDGTAPNVVVARWAAQPQAAEKPRKAMAPSVRAPRKRGRKTG